MCISAIAEAARFHQPPRAPWWFLAQGTSERFWPIVSGADTYMEYLSSYAPLVLAGDNNLSSVTQLSRFAYSWRTRVLDRNKRFQIRAGFIFEDVVKVCISR